MRAKRLQKLLIDIYTQLFKEATPSVDYQWLLDNAEEVNKDIDWFNKYVIPKGSIDRIIDEQIKINKLRLNAFEKVRIRNTIYLGHSPKEI